MPLKFDKYVNNYTVEIKEDVTKLEIEYICNNDDLVTIKNNDNLEYVLVQLSYAIGLKNPLAIYITSDKGDLKVPDDLYEKCSVQNIINSLNLLNEKYEKRAMFGHFID